MKIDIHTHTKKCKSGDASTREVSPERFCEAVLATAVRIIAITNHNVFDLAQYESIKALIGNGVQVWPGIEFDILDNGSRGHLLVIVSPAVAKNFAEIAAHFTAGSTPDNFTTTVDKVLEKFESLKPLYVAHHTKQPKLSEESLKKLVEGTKSRPCIIKEVTNSISAGIYISHGHASIYGSDIHDWAKYEELSHKLPDLRLPVDTFEQFCLLLAKDPATINTALNTKTPEELVLRPFEDKKELRLKVFNDINVIFGPKGTGKSRILEAIAKHYAEKGTEAKVFSSSKAGLDEIFDTKGKYLKIELADHGINQCKHEIETLRSAAEVQVTSLSKYQAHFAAQTANQNAKRILLKDIALEDANSAKREFSNVDEAIKKTQAFMAFLDTNAPVQEELTDEERKQLTKILADLLERLKEREWNSFAGWKEITLLNSAITLWTKQVELKTGAAGKPPTPGFSTYAMNRIKIERCSAELLKNVDTKIPVRRESIGSLGSGKGELEYITEFEFQTGSVRDSSLVSFAATTLKRKTQQEFVKGVRDVHASVYTDELFPKLAQLNELEGVAGIYSVFELLFFRRYFALAGEAYDPSDGEASMLMLQKELGADKDVYILDEPEMSLGNEYISEVIVPLLKERARASKKVFISTHDANIAVRTLPYSSIYRLHGKGGYRTYVGNPFSNNLVNLDGSGDPLDWKKTSMKTLEGGEEAFGERGTIYGNS